MDKCVSKLTVYFEAPFWVGVYERQCESGYEVCKITFGAEPKDYEVYEFILKHWAQLTFSPSIQSKMCKEQKPNPKRMQRNIHKELQQQGVGTKAQQALKLQQEQSKQKRKASAKEKREQEAIRRFALRQEKRKAKHRGH